MPKFWLWLLAASLFYCEMIAEQGRLDTCFCENTLLDVNCFNVHFVVWRKEWGSQFQRFV